MPKNVLKEKSIEIKNSGKGSIVVNIVSPPVVNRKKPRKAVTFDTPAKKRATQ